MFVNNDGTQIVGQIFTSNGEKSGNNFNIYSGEGFVEINNLRESLVGLYHGGFVVSWIDDNSHVNIREYDASGTALTSGFLLEHFGEPSSVRDLSLVSLSTRYIIMWVSNSNSLFYRYSDESVIQGTLSSNLISGVRWNTQTKGYLTVRKDGGTLVVEAFNELSVLQDTEIITVAGEIDDVKIKPILGVGDKAVVFYRSGGLPRSTIIDFVNDLTTGVSLIPKDEGSSWEDFISIPPFGYHVAYLSLDNDVPTFRVASSDASLSVEAEISQVPGSLTRSQASIVRIGTSSSNWMIFYRGSNSPMYIRKIFTDVAILEQKQAILPPKSASLASGGSVSVYSYTEGGTEAYYTVFDGNGIAIVSSMSVLDSPMSSHTAVRVVGFRSKPGFIIALIENNSIFIRRFNGMGSPESVAVSVISNPMLRTDFDMEITINDNVIIVYHTSELMYLELTSDNTQVTSHVIRSQVADSKPSVWYHPVTGTHILSISDSNSLTVDTVTATVSNQVLAGTLGALNHRIKGFPDGTLFIVYTISLGVYYNVNGNAINILVGEDAGDQDIVDLDVTREGLVMVLFTNSVCDNICDIALQYRLYNFVRNTIVPTSVPTWQDGHIIGNQQFGSISSYGGNGFLVSYLSEDSEGLISMYVIKSKAATPLIQYSPEFKINSFDKTLQVNPTSCGLSNGGVIVVWSGKRQDGSGWGILGQLYSSSGATVGNEFQLNDNTLSDQQYPSVGCYYRGFVVVYQSTIYKDVDIYSRRFQNDGTPSTAGVKVNTISSTQDMHPQIASHEYLDDSHVITWQSFSNQVASVIKFRRYDGEVSQYDPVADANTITDTTMRYPRVCMGEDGQFAITWQSLGTDGSRYDVYTRTYNLGGVANFANQILVNTYSDSSQSNAHCGMLPGGNFVITWQSAKPNIFNDVYGQLLSFSTGNKYGSEFQVNSDQSGNQKPTSIVTFLNGDFIITWSSSGNVYYRKFDRSGMPAITGAIANTYTDLQQSNGCVTRLGSGGLFISWESRFQDNTRQSIYGMAGKFTDLQLEVLSSTTSGNQHYSTAITRSNGGVFFAYRVPVPEGNEIRGRYLNELNEWSSSRQVDSDVDKYDTTAGSSSGYWMVSLEITNRISVTQLSSSGNPSTPSFTVADTLDVSTYSGAAVTQDSNNNLYFAIVGDNSIYVESFTFTAALNGPTLVSSEFNSRNPIILYLTKNNVVVLWETGSNGNYMRFLNSGLNVLGDSIQLFQSSANQKAIVLNDGRILVCFYVLSSGLLSCQAYLNDGSTSGSSFNLVTKNFKGEFSLLPLSNGNFMMSHATVAGNVNSLYLSECSTVGLFVRTQLVTNAATTSHSLARWQDSGYAFTFTTNNGNMDGDGQSVIVTFKDSVLSV